MLKEERMSRRIDVGAQYDFDLEHALFGTPENYTLYLPAEIRRYVAPGPGMDMPEGWRVARPNMTLEGDGRFSGEDAGLWPWADPAVPELKGTGDSSIIRIGAQNLTLRGLTLSNDRGFVKGSGDHISFREPFTVGGPSLYELSVLYAGRHCLHLAPRWNDNGTANYVVNPLARDCVFYGAGSDGIVLDTCNVTRMDHVTTTQHNGRGIVLRRCGVFSLDLVAESVNGGALLEASGPGEIGGHFEQFARGGWDDTAAHGLTEPAIILDNCRGVTVRASTFEDWTGANPTSILLRNGTTGCTIETSTHAGVGLSVDDGGCRGNVIHRQTWPSWHPPVAWRVNAKRNTVI
jgi:hypothetical protein